MPTIFFCADGLCFVCLQQERKEPSNYGEWIFLTFIYPAYIYTLQLPHVWIEILNSYEYSILFDSRGLLHLFN